LAVKKRTIIIIILLSLVVMTATLVKAWFYLSEKVSRLDTYKEIITKTAREKLDRSLSYETATASLTLRDGIVLQFTNVVVKEKDGSSDLLTVQNASIRVSVLPLLINRIVLGKVVLREPHIALRRDSSGVLNIADLLKRE